MDNDRDWKLGLALRITCRRKESEYPMKVAFDAKWRYPEFAIIARGKLEKSSAYFAVTGVAGHVHKVVHMAFQTSRV
jgi:hypothetical protein